MIIWENKHLFLLYLLLPNRVKIDWSTKSVFFSGFNLTKFVEILFMLMDVSLKFHLIMYIIFESLFQLMFLLKISLPKNIKKI